MKYRVEFLRKPDGLWETLPTFRFDDRPTAEKFSRIVRKAADCVDARVVEVPE